MPAEDGEQPVPGLGGEEQRSPKWPTTDAQREARRRNGRLGGKQTPAGRINSDQARLVHGVYASRVPVITMGPLREDPGEAEEFIRLEVERLDPQSPLEQVLAEDFAQARWRKRRALRYEALGYSAISDENADAGAEQQEALLRVDRVAKAVLEDLDNDAVTIAPWALCRTFEELLDLASAPEAEWEAARNTTPADLRHAVRSYVEITYGGLANAQAAVSKAERERAAATAELQELPRANAARAAITDSFTTRLIAAEAHLDRQIRYILKEFKERKTDS